MDTNITRAETRQRAGLLEVVDYTMAIDLRDAADPEVATFASTTTVRFRCRQPGQSTWIDLVAAELRDATLNGRTLKVGDYDGARLELQDLPADNELVIRADCRYMTTGEGLHRMVDPADGATYLYTQFATAEARRVFACFEQPDLKARFGWEVVAPEGWRVLSNSPTPVPEPAGPGLARWRFAPTPPLSTYLAAICAGPYAAFTGECEGPYGSVPLGVFVRRSAVEHLDADEFLDITRAGLRHYEELFARPLPFPKYDQVCVPEFNLGAMENPGLVTFREELAVFRSRVTDASREHRAMVILHEMAHMWFGDLVTMRWWDDVWLNESFATWCGYGTTAEATRFTESWTDFALSQKAWAYRQDQLPSTHPISADMVDLEAVYLSFDGITYAKGASVLKQLVAYVGLDAFVAGVRRYFDAHAWGNATLADLLAELSAASGRDLEEWARLWLTLPGVTTLRPVVEVDEAGRYRRVAVEQLPPSRPAGVPATLRPHRIAVGLYRWATHEGCRRLVRDLRVEVDVPGESVEVPELVGHPVADLLLVNDDDLTYAKVELDPGSLATALADVGALADPLARALVWGAIWELVRDARLPAQEFVRVALAGLREETRPRIIDLVFGWMRTALSHCVAPELREEVALEMCATSAELLDAAPQATDRQLSLALAHIQAAVAPHRLVRLADLLSGAAQLPGLPLDDELRWAIVLRLTSQGAASEALVDDILAADRTSSGQRSAARARAAIPTAEAKQAAWDLAVTAGAQPNALLEGTAAGFSDPSTPPELLHPYRARYFAEIAGLFAARSPAEAQTVARGLFPPVAPQTLAGARRLLEDPDLPSGLRRIVAEQADDVERALACRELSRRSG